MGTHRNIGCDIPALVISESTELSDIQEAFKNGADDYMGFNTLIDNQKEV